MTMFHNQDLRDALVDESVAPGASSPTCSPGRSRTSSWTRPRS